MFWVSVIVLVMVSPYRSTALICSRYPANTFSLKSPVDENFAISISGNPRTYILGQPYNISVNAFNGLKFISFKLALENDNGASSYDWDLGRFELSDTVETRFSPNCINMVENTNNNPKTRVEVIWVAPEQPGSGCILIRATLLQHRDVWYMDDGGLTKRICEEAADDVESLSISSSEQLCCACDEARYELTFEGTWSRNLHPKDFPAKGWIARFSDIVGVAHAADYRFWEYGSLATEGIKELAEHGSTSTLEKEFNYNFKYGKIRTIIKARGPAFPNLNGQSVASVRVDPQHHLLSLASKIDPSPDWIVGVSGLELCMKNCTWIEQKVVTLYPWDVGTDAGATYTSPDQPQIPPDVIRRMRSDFPNDPRSPFFDATGAPMKPLAVLTIRKQRLYERLCEDEESNNIDVPRECFTHPWSAWSPCTADCGEGRQFRTRVYKQPEVARIYNCDDIMVNRQDRACIGNACKEPQYANNMKLNRLGEENAEDAFEPSVNRAECQLTAWGPWTECSKTCGEGKMMRRRQYVNSGSEQKCQSIRYARLIENAKCFGRCLGEIPNKNREEYELKQESAQESDMFQGNTLENERIENTVRGMSTNDFEEQKFPVQGSYYENNLRPPIFREHDENEKETGEKDLNSAEDDGYRRPPYENRENVNPYQEPDFDNNIELEHDTDIKGSYDVNAAENEIEDNFPNQNHIGFPYAGGRHIPHTQEPQLPMHCFQPLKVFKCLDITVVGNFWFYNYCEDECMLYAADSCDENDNKFTSLEKCEEQCRQQEYADFLRRKQSQDCFKPERRKNPRKFFQRYKHFSKVYE